MTQKFQAEVRQLVEDDGSELDQKFILKLSQRDENEATYFQHTSISKTPGEVWELELKLRPEELDVLFLALYKWKVEV